MRIFNIIFLTSVIYFGLLFFPQGKVVFADLNPAILPLKRDSLIEGNFQNQTSPSLKQEVGDLREQISDLKSQLNALQKYIEEKDQKVTYLTKQLIDFALRLSEKELLLNEKVEKLSAMNEELKEFNSRIELGERIIKEKDEKVVTLQHSVEVLSNQIIKKDLEDKVAAASYENQMRWFNGILQIYREKLKKSSQTLILKDQDFNKLRGELSLFQREKKVYLGTIFEKEQEIKTLKRMIDHLRMPQGKIEELNETQLKGCQTGFCRRINFFDDKADEIIFLDHQLSDIGEDLVARGKKLVKANQDLASLEEKFTIVQNKVFEKNGLESNNEKEVHWQVKQELNEIQGSLKTIQVFLKKQLEDFRLRERYPIFPGKANRLQRDG